MTTYITLQRSSNGDMRDRILVRINDQDVVSRYIESDEESTDVYDTYSEAIFSYINGAAIAGYTTQKLT